MSAAGRYPAGELGRAPFRTGGPSPELERVDPATGAPEDGASILRDPRASDPEKSSGEGLEPVSEGQGSRRISIDELGRVGVTPPDELTGAGRAALESELEPLSGIPGLYIRGPGGSIVRYELTEVGELLRHVPAEAFARLPHLDELVAEVFDAKRLEEEDAADAELERREIERRGVLSRHARAVAAELDGKEPPRDRRERRSSELERELVGKLAQEDAADAELAEPLELETLEELRERVARERAPWLFMGARLP